MKQDNQAKKLASLLKRLESTYTVEPPPQRDPVLQLIAGFLQWRATHAQAELALERLLGAVVDVNELRVSLEQEIHAVLGPRYPLLNERVARMREALNEIYHREHAMEMHSIADRGKKEQRAYLDSLPGVPSYVAALVTLLSFGGHAMPIDDKMAALLAHEEAIDPGTPPDQVEASLLRRVKADDSRHVYLLLQAWADDSKAPAEPAPEPRRKSSKAARPARTAKAAPAARTARTSKATTSTARKKTASKKVTKTTTGTKKTTKKTTASARSSKKKK